MGDGRPGRPFAFVGLTYCTETDLPIRLAVSIARWASSACSSGVNKKGPETHLDDRGTAARRGGNSCPIAAGSVIRSAGPSAIVSKEIPRSAGVRDGPDSRTRPGPPIGRDYGRGRSSISPERKWTCRICGFSPSRWTIQQTGAANLAEDPRWGLAKVIRGAASKLFRRVKAITAEAKWSGCSCRAFPPIVALDDDQRDLSRKLLRRREGNLGLRFPPVLVVAGFLIRNVIVMRPRLVNIQGLRAGVMDILNTINTRLTEMLGPFGPLYRSGRAFSA